MSECPTCGGTLGALKGVTQDRNILATGRGFVTLGPVEEAMVRNLIEFPAGIKIEDLIAAVYPNGGTLAARKTMHAHISKIRYKLTRLGLAVRAIGNSGPGGTIYILSHAKGDS